MRTLGRFSGTIALVTLVFSGCPKKLQPVETECPPAVAPAPAEEPKPPVASLVTAAVLTAGSSRRAILANSGYATVVGEKDKVGAEGAIVVAILSDAVTVQLPDGKTLRLALVTELPSSAPAGTAPALPGEAPPVEVAPGPTTDVEAWRQSVMGGIAKGYGVPYEVLLAVAVSLTGTDDPGVANAHRGLGFEPAPGLEKVRLDRFDVRDGTVRLEGGAAGPEVVQALKRRLENCKPVIAAVSDGTAPVRTDTLTSFAFTLQTLLVRGQDVAQADAPAGIADASRAARLLPHAGNIAPSSVLAGFEGEVRTAGTRAGFKAFEVTREDALLEDGSLGTVSYSVFGTGGLPAAVAFLKSVKPPQGNVGGVPVVLDPIEITHDGFKATIRVPFLTGKADARDPGPAPLSLSRLLDQRWTNAIHPSVKLRDSLKH